MTPGAVSQVSARDSATAEYVVSVRDLRTYFPIREGVFQRVAGHIRAVDGITFDVRRGETVGLVGESGCGKSTLARCVAGLMEPTHGGVYFGLDARTRQRLDELLAVGGERTRQDEGELAELARRHRVDALVKPYRQRYRQNCQVVFQDAFSSLNPRQLVRDIVGRPLRIHRGVSGSALTERVVELLGRVGLGRQHLYRYPHQFSGGQRQRISIARALALEPEFVILDEPTSALDVSVQAQILNLLHRLQEEHGLTYLFISHDLNVVRHMSDRIIVMYLGQICEVGGAEQLFLDPRHPYTEALLAANPGLEDGGRTRIRLRGTVPSPADPPSGCRFHTRCPQVTAVCGWDVNDALSVLRERGDLFEKLVGERRESPFVTALTFDSAAQASAAAEALRSPLVPDALRAAMPEVRASGDVVRIGFEPVDEVALVELGDGRATACVLHTGQGGAPP